MPSCTGVAFVSRLSFRDDEEFPKVSALTHAFTPILHPIQGLPLYPLLCFDFTITWPHLEKGYCTPYTREI